VIERLRRAGAGTPAHRIHGSAVVLMLAAAQAAGEQRSLPSGALHALRTLGVTGAGHFVTAARETLLAWDRQLHAGERTAELGSAT
jgi:hypothetical protein